MDGVRAVCFVRDPAVDVGVSRSHAVYRFRGAVAVRVVGEGQRAARLAHARQLAIMRRPYPPINDDIYVVYVYVYLFPRHGQSDSQNFLPNYGKTSQTTSQWH